MKTRVVSVVIAASLVLAACGGGSGGDTSGVARNNALSTGIDSGLAMDKDSFSFANFGASATAEQFDGSDLEQMFGGSKDVCKDGKTNPCVPVAEAAVWARMVNQARQSGHCEGFAVLAAERFSENAMPRSVELKNEGDVTHGLMRAFATQFLPEVQKETTNWQKKKPSAIVEELSKAFESKSVPYSMGLYTDTGGHAVLPRSIKFLDGGIARVSIYDSNWPGGDRYVDINTNDETWKFSYSGADPANDPDAWTGGEGDIDLTPMQTRFDSKCPFCGDGSGVQKTILVLRSADPNWSVTTPDGVIKPGGADTASGSTRPIKRAEGDTTPVDYVVVLDSNVEATFRLPSATKVTGVTPKAAVEFSSPGSDAGEIVVAETAVSSNDPTTVLTLATGDLAATANGAQTNLKASAELIAVKVETTTGETINASVTPDAPAVEVKTAGNPTLAKGVAYEVVTQTGANEVTREVATDDGKKTTTVETGSIAVSKVEADLPPALQYADVSPALPPAETRTFEEAIRTKNASLDSTTTTTSTTEPETTTTVTTTTVAPTTTTTVAKSTTTTVKPKPTTTTAAPTTTVASTTTAASTTTVAATTTTEAPTTTVAATTTTVAPAQPSQPQITEADTWVALASAPGNTQARDVASDGVGNTYALGAFCNSSVNIGGTVLNGANVVGQAHCNISVAKFDKEGSVVWARAIVGSGQQNWGTAIDVDTNGDVYVIGDFTGSALSSGSVVLSDQASGQSNNEFVMKFNSAGVAQWGRVLGGTTTTKIGWADIAVEHGVAYVTGTIPGQGNSVVLGNNTLTAQGSEDFFVTRLDVNTGAYIWANRYGSVGGATSLAVTDVDPTGNLYVSGTFDSYGLIFGTLPPLVNASAYTTDVFVAKFSEQGVPTWSVRGGGAAADSAEYIGASATGASFVVSIASSSATFGNFSVTRSGNQSTAVVNVSSSGSFESAFALTSGDFWATGVVRDSGGDVYVSGVFSGSTNFLGTTVVSAGYQDAVVMRMSASGALSWVRRFGNASTTYDTYIASALGGGINAYFDNSDSSSVTVGSTTHQMNDLDSLIVHIRGDGTLP